MKNLKLSVSLFIAFFSIVACEPIEQETPNPSNDCNDGWGTLHVTNKSNSTVQTIRISGTNYGSLDPGESKTIELPVGSYTVEINGLSGGSGCSPSEVNIPDCGTVGRSCSH
jgi:hypothetical protein